MTTLPDRQRRDTAMCLLPLLTVLLGSLVSADAQTITGSLNPYEHPQYAGIDAHFLITGAQIDGESVYDGNMVIICTDYAALSIDDDRPTYPLSLTGSYPPLSEGVTDQLDVWNLYDPRDEGLATAQAMWMIDRFYQSYFTNPPADQINERQYAFQNAIWEIFGDGGSTAGLDFNTGEIIRSKFGPGGISEAPELWTHMNILIDAVNSSGVTAAYQPTYQVITALDARGGYQDYLGLALTPSLMLVPEPASGSLILLSATLLLGHRRRHVAG